MSGEQPIRHVRGEGGGRERREKQEKFQTFNRPKVKATKATESGVQFVDYKDTETLRKLVSGNGKLLTRKRTGASAMDQRMIAQAVVEGSLDFALVERLPPDEAMAYLTAHKGIGPWSAEIYLMFCSGHPDIFPAGDLALQKAVGHALVMEDVPTAKQLVESAESWSPYRHAAALLFWKFYAAVIRKAGGIRL